MAGKFIVIEGIDGAGTTTQTRLAAEWLRSMKLDVVETREPTAGPVGKLIRAALSSRFPGREGHAVEPELFALLFAADRMDHMAAIVEPALDDGKIVLSDRCYLSSFAYQSVGCDLAWVREINRHCHRADLIILLDVGAKEAFARIDGKRAESEVFETVNMMSAVRRRYLEISATLEKEGDRIVIVDGAKPVDIVAARIQSVISELI